MDKSVISTFKENIELAASKYDSISLHLNALKQRVLGSRSIDTSKPVSTVTLSNEQEEARKESLDETPCEHKQLDPKFVYSDNDLAYCDANSNVSEESTSSSQFAGSAERDEENIEPGQTEDHESLKGMKSIPNESDRESETKTPGYEQVKIAGISCGEKKDDFKSSSSSSDSSLSDEDNENIYSELLKRIEQEEEKRSLYSQKDEESDSESNRSDSVPENIEKIPNKDDSKGRDMVNNSEVLPPVKKSFSQRAKEIMESIEEDNEEWEALGQQLISRGMEEITYEKLFSLKEKNLEDYSEDFCNLKGNKAEESSKTINTKRTVSKVSNIECKKSDSHQTFRSKTLSLDNINVSTGQESQKHSATSSKAKKVLPKSETLAKERLVKKSTPSSKYISKKALRPEKVIKSKPMNTVHRIATTKFSKNTKLKNNVKKISKTLPQKNFQGKSNVDQESIKTSKNNFSKPIQIIEKEKSSLTTGKSLDSNSSNEEMKKPIEPLIKSKPDNIFLKKELDRITEGQLNIERGAGDGLDKVRSQAIVSPMNQSINKLNKPNVQNKNKETVIGAPFSSSVLSNKPKEQHKLYNSNANTSKINVTKKFDQPYMKKSTQNISKKVDNPERGKSRGDINKDVGSKRTKSRRESTAIDPKEILAQLEKEASFPKCIDNYDTENVKVETLYSKVSLDIPASRQSKIFTPKDVKSDLKRNKSEINKNENNNAKQNNEFTKSLQPEVPLKPGKHTVSKGDNDNNRKSNRVKSSKKLKNIDFNTEHQEAMKKEVVKNETFSAENISNKMISLDFDGTKPKIISFPFILGQSTSKSYNIQANVQQTMSVMMMLPSESVRKTLSVETKISSKASTQTALTINSTLVKCPACLIKNDQDYSNDNQVDDPWDTEYTSRNFVRCTCIPRNTVSFKTVMKQLLSDPSIGSLLPLSETSTLYEESIDKNNENKQLCRRSDLTRLLHATQRIRERLVT